VWSGEKPAEADTEPKKPVWWQPRLPPLPPAPQLNRKDQQVNMARRGQAKIRKIEPDPLYNSVLVAKFINKSMRSGKKSVAQKEVYRAFEIIKEKTGTDPTKILIQAMENVKPNMEVKPRRVGGAAYQVPMPVRGPRKESLAVRWIINLANARSSSEFHTYAEKLAAELTDAAKGEGGAVKKRTDMERVAEANRAFAHFNW